MSYGGAWLIEMGRRVSILFDICIRLGDGVVEKGRRCWRWKEMTDDEGVGRMGECSRVGMGVVTGGGVAQRCGDRRSRTRSVCN